MSDHRAASLGELESALNPLGASAEFINSQLREGVSLHMATARFAGILHGENRDLRAKVAGLESESASKKASAKEKSPYQVIPDIGGGRAGYGGTSQGAGRRQVPFGFGPGDENVTAKAQWDAELKALTDTGIQKPVAIQKLVRENPELHQAYLAEVNADRV